MQYNLLYTELARILVCLSDGIVESRSFSDYDVLDRSVYDVHKFYDTDKDSEWYKVDLQFDVDWDIIIYDEAHEGTRTEQGKAVQSLS